jgi:hypothetical protein
MLVRLLTIALCSACIIDSNPFPEAEKTDYAAAPGTGDQQGDDTTADQAGRDAADAGRFNVDAYSFAHFEDAESEPILLVATAGAAPASAELTITANDTRVVTTNAAGGFVTRLDADLGATITIAFREAGEEYTLDYTLTLAVGSFTEDAETGAAPVIDALAAATPSASAVATDDTILVSGSAPAGMRVVVANAAQNQSASTLADADGAFSVNLPGASGNPLTLLFLVPELSSGAAYVLDVVAE